MAKTKGEIEATLKNISIKEKEVNFKHDENMEEKKNKHTLDMAKLSADIEKSKLENNYCYSNLNQLDNFFKEP